MYLMRFSLYWFCDLDHFIRIISWYQQYQICSVYTPACCGIFRFHPHEDDLGRRMLKLPSQFPISEYLGMFSRSGLALLVSPAGVDGIHSRVWIFKWPSWLQFHLVTVAGDRNRLDKLYLFAVPVADLLQRRPFKSRTVLKLALTVVGLSRKNPSVISSPSSAEIAKPT